MRRNLANVVRKKVIEIKSCNLNDIITNIEVGTSGVSDSLIFSGDLIIGSDAENDSASLKALRKSIVDFPNKVLLKVSRVHTDITKDNSVEIEQAIYKNVVNKMLFGQITPHLVAYVTMFECGNFRNTLETLNINEGSKTAAIKRWDQMGSTMNSDYRKSHGIANVLMLEMNKTKMTLKQFLQSKTTTLNQILSVIFQVFYTLHCFNKASPPLRHNDLHFDNILVDIVPEEDITYVLGPDEAYKVNTNGVMIKIFDFDRSYNGTENTLLDGPDTFCDEYGSCNIDNPYFDTFTALYCFNQYISNYVPDVPESGTALEIRKKLRETITDNNKYFKNSPPFAFARPHLMCKVALGSSNPVICNGEITNPESIFPLPETVIRAIFKTGKVRFRVNISTVDFSAPTTFFSSKRLRQIKLKKVPKTRASPASPSSSPIDGVMRRFNPNCELPKWPDNATGRGIKEQWIINTVFDELKSESLLIRDYSLILDTLFSNEDLSKKNLFPFRPNYSTKNILISFLKTENTCTYDLIYKCSNFTTPKQTKIILENSARVENMLLIMMSHPEYFAFSPEERAQFIIAKVLKQPISNDRLETLFATKPTSLNRIIRTPEGMSYVRNKKPSSAKAIVCPEDPWKTNLVNSPDGLDRPIEITIDWLVDVSTRFLKIGIQEHFKRLDQMIFVLDKRTDITARNLQLLACAVWALNDVNNEDINEKMVYVSGGENIKEDLKNLIEMREKVEQTFAEHGKPISMFEYFNCEGFLKPEELKYIKSEKGAKDILQKANKIAFSYKLLAFPPSVRAKYLVESVAVRAANYPEFDKLFNESQTRYPSWP